MDLVIVITKVEKYYRIVNICLKAGTPLWVWIKFGSVVIGYGREVFRP